MCKKQKRTLLYCRWLMTSWPDRQIFLPMHWTSAGPLLPLWILALELHHQAACARILNNERNPLLKGMYRDVKCLVLFGSLWYMSPSWILLSCSGPSQRRLGREQEIYCWRVSLFYWTGKTHSRFGNLIGILFVNIRAVACVSISCSPIIGQQSKQKDPKWVNENSI